LRKFQPRFSTRRDPTFSLNGKVEIDGDKILCRHIALLWEKEFLRTAGKPDYQTFDNPAALERAAEPLLLKDKNKDGNAVSERIDQAQYWMSTDWGQVIADNFKAMASQPGEDSTVCRTLYLLTSNHAMALGLKIKDKAGARRYVVQFYDPNNTVSHKRLAISAESGQTGMPAEIGKLEPRDFLPDHLRMKYRLVDAENRSIPMLFVGEKLGSGVTQARLAGDLPDLDRHVMHALMTHNLPELRDYARQLRQVDDTTRMEMLGTRNDHGASGLHHALEWGHAEVVEVFGEMLGTFQTRPTPGQLMDLLSAKSSHGTPGLYLALQNGHARTVRAFGKVLKTFRTLLSPEQLAELLSAKSSAGNPGLYLALQNGHAETIQAYAEILKSIAADLSPEQLTELLWAKSSNGTPGVQAAARNGHAAAVAVFEDLLAQPTAACPDS